MDTFRLVLARSDGLYKPIVFRLLESGPDHILCVKGNFGKGPLVFFGLQTNPQPHECVLLNQVFGVRLIGGATVRRGSSPDRLFEYQGLVFPEVFQASL